MTTNQKSLIDTYRVQESDSNFFESFTALSWRQENKRLRAASDVSITPYMGWHKFFMTLLNVTDQRIFFFYKDFNSMDHLINIFFLWIRNLSLMQHKCSCCFSHFLLVLWLKGVSFLYTIGFDVKPMFLPSIKWNWSFRFSQVAVREINRNKKDWSVL